MAQGSRLKVVAHPPGSRFITIMNADAVALALAGTKGRLQREQVEMQVEEVLQGLDPGKAGFVEALLFLFGWGSLSLPNVQWLASLALDCGATHPDLTKLAGIGMGGKYQGNMRRDLLQAFCHDNILPDPVPVEVT